MLTEQYVNLKGVTKEIDDLRREVLVIKKHLGLSTEIAVTVRPGADTFGSSRMP